MRKTLTGAIASTALLLSLFFGLAQPAEAQDTTPTPEPTATAAPTPTPDAVPTATPDPAATPSPTPDPSAVLDDDGDDGENIGEAFVVDTPNPQPSEPLTPQATPDATAAATDTAGAATDATAATDEVLGESQLAFTGPDTRVFLLAVGLLGLGAAFVATGRRQRERLAFEDSWVE